MNKFIFLILIILTICCITLENLRKESFTNKYLYVDKYISKYYLKPYKINIGNNEYDNIFKHILNDIPLDIYINNNDNVIYNNFKNNKYDMGIVSNRLLKFNDKFKFVTNISYTYLYMIVKTDSDITTFSDCINKKIAVFGTKLTYDLAKSIFKLLGIYDKMELYNGNNEKLHNDFYYNNKYDAVFIENNYYDGLSNINKDYYKNKNINIITGDEIVNGVNELDYLLKLLFYDESIHTINKKRIILKNHYFKFTKKYETFIILPKTLICNNNVDKIFIYNLVKILNKYNLIKFNNTNIEFIDKNIHSGTLQYLKELNIINYKLNSI